MKAVSGGVSMSTNGRIHVPINPVAGSGPVHVPTEDAPVQVTVNPLFVSGKSSK